MVFVACGLNHKTAPLCLREKVASTLQHSLLFDSLKFPELDEGVILSTCNRTEIYCETKEPDHLVTRLAVEYQLPAESSYFYAHHAEEGIRHLLRVASGLDSMMIGEPQILGQIKQAYQHACEQGQVKAQLRPIFEYVFSASKKVRTQSGICLNPISVAYAAVQLIGQLFSKYKNLKVFLIGSGETASLVAKYLHQEGVNQFMIASRSLENAQKLSKVFGGRSIPIINISQHLFEADVVISATTCPVPFINKDLIEYALKKRANKPMFLLDLAVPRDIEQNVKELDQVSLYNIDDLQALITKGMEERRQAALKAESLIEKELENYKRQHRISEIKDLICDYRTRMETMAHIEAQRALKQLASGGLPQKIFNEFSQRLINKLTHSPTIGLKQVASDNREDLLALAQYLFNQTKKPSYEEIT